MSLVKTMPALALLALVACATDDVNEATALHNPMAQTPPPGQYGIELDVDGALVPGSTLTFQVSGLAANERVFIVRGSGLNAGGFCPNPLNGLCLDVRGASVQFSMVADASGLAQRSLTVPNLPAGQLVWWQAATPGATAATSLVVPKFNLAPASAAGRSYGLIISEDAQVTPGQSYSGLREEVLYSNPQSDPATGNYLDICSLELSGAGSDLGAFSPCADCEWAFAVNYASGRDTSVAGDCVDTIGFDPSTIAPFDIGRGFSSAYYLSGYGDVTTVFGYDTTGAAWVPQVFSAQPGAIFDPTTGVFGWAVDFGGTYAY
jgi:hypothetical protein